MNTKLAIALLLLLSFTAGACMIDERGDKMVGAPQLEAELEALKKVYQAGEIDEREYDARQQMLVTVWELKVRDQQSL